jgi:membrane protease YdiL (CAAX protease family)
VVLIASIVLVFPNLQVAAGSSYDEVYNQVMNLLNSRLGLIQSIATIASGLVGVGLIIVFIRMRKRADVQEYLGINSLSLKGALVSLGTIIGLIAIIDLLFYLLGVTTNEGIVPDLYKSSIWPPLFWIAVVVFAPLFEEAFFRGFAFEGFRQSRLGTAGAILLTSFGWAIMHAVQYSFLSIVWIFVLGIALGIAKVRTKSLWAPFLMHAAVNFVATLGLAMHWNV